MTKPGPGQLIAAVGGAVLIASLFMPWTETEGVSASGWELWSGTDVLFVMAALFAFAAALTGGRIGLFRPDVSFNGATDVLGVASTAVIAWFILFDFPEGAGREIGAYLALIGAATVACGAADWSVLRGAPAFPNLTEGAHRHGEVGPTAP